MAEKLDLLKIAQEEQTGDLFKLLDQTFKRSKVQPRGISDAIIWEGGNQSGNVKPVAHEKRREERRREKRSNERRQESCRQEIILLSLAKRRGYDPAFSFAVFGE